MKISGVTKSNPGLTKRMSDVLAMINYMANEVANGISDAIYRLADEDDKNYAIKKELTSKMEVKFYLLNISNNTQACMAYTYEEFALYCSDVAVMREVFENLAQDLLAAVQKSSSNIVYLNKHTLIN